MRRQLVLVPLLLATTVRAEDWPQFLGPRRDGTSKETVAAWTGEPKIVWRAPVGEGHSSPVVANGLVFLLDKPAEANAERLSVYDAAGGKLVGHFEQKRDPFQSPFGAGPRATPTVVGDTAYFYGVTGRFAAVRVTRDGGTTSIKPLFDKELLKEFKAKNLTFGVSASPLVDGDLVVNLVGGQGAGVVALNRTTGDVAWKALDDPASYASAVAVGESAKRQIVVLTQRGLASLSPADGTVNWKHPFQDTLNESSTTPLQVGNLLLASSVTLGSVALKLGEKDGKPAVEQVWKRPELTCYFSTPVAVGTDHVYMITGSFLPRPSVSLRCVEVATGKTLWTKANVGKYHAALVKTGDDKLLMLDDAGRLTLIQPDSKEYRQLAQSKVCGDTWAHPALANGRVYLRDAKELLCIELGK